MPLTWFTLVTSGKGHARISRKVDPAGVSHIFGSCLGNSTLLDPLNFNMGDIDSNYAKYEHICEFRNEDWGKYGSFHYVSSYLDFPVLMATPFLREQRQRS